MFALSTSPIDARALQDAMRRPEAGAFVCFEGWVRNTNEGRTVTLLEYEAFEAVACSEGSHILHEARERFGLLDARCAHRVGALAIGDMAVWVGVVSGHRGEAFAACRYIIDEVKKRVPIWKKEHYSDGDSGWVNCECHCGAEVHVHAEPVTEAQLYARQVCLPEVSQEGQDRLRRGRVLIVGAGGLGCPAALYLAAAGVGEIGICDSDTVDASNLHRQILFGIQDIGAPKAERAVDRIKSMYPFTIFTPYPERLTDKNAMEMFCKHDIILDCTDNFEVKFLINDAAVLSKKSAVFASIYQWEGQVQVYQPGTETPCLRCQWPDMPEPDCVRTCAEAGVLGAVPGVFGAMQALEALKLLLGRPALPGLLLFDLLSGQPHRAGLKRSASCPVCGTNPTIRSVDPANYGDGLDVEVEGAGEGNGTFDGFEVIDIREPQEIRERPLAGLKSTAIPASRFEQDSLPLSTDGRYLLCCAHGARSKYLARRLRARGYPHVFSLKGGAEALV
ncbi:MAG: ThiF family adenylyltransferase [Candidatus Hydrogenedentes bacterium]|nr:ThiF family adenylyltransferase [Candidatus Hydrogenedentota bacterium]